ncbi:MAG: hypothetical protein ACO29O_05495 [Chitinophagaceae bacterium]
MSVDNVSPKRPVVITILISIIIIAGILNLIYSFTGVYASLGLLYPAAMALLTVGAVASISAIWVMEKWGVYVYTGLTVLKLALDFYVHALEWWSICFLVPVIVFWYWFKKMK